MLESFKPHLIVPSATEENRVWYWISVDISGRNQRDNLNESHGFLWVGKKLLGEINQEAATVICVHLEGHLSISLNELMDGQRQLELPEHDWWQCDPP